MNSLQWQLSGIKLMKFTPKSILRPTDKSAPKLTSTQSSSPPEEANEFEQFKDEQFTKHRRNQLNYYKIKQKSINCLNVHTPNTNINHLTSFHQDECSKYIGSKTKEVNPSCGFRYVTDEMEEKLQQERRLLEDEQQKMKGSDKIGLIKKILELYNSKAIEKTYYSNLIKGLAPKINQPQDKSITIKKIHPRNSFRHQKKAPDLSKLSHINMHGFDIVEDYYNHRSITLQAQGMNDLIKQCLHRKRQSKTQNTTRKPKSRSNLDLSNANPSPCSFKASPSKLKKWSQAKANILQGFSGDNSLSNKINKFREFLFMVNLGSGVYRGLDIVKYEESVKIYVGKGNNSQLVKEIIKKRFWFEVTKHREEANLIWAQLKDEKIYSRQQERKRGNPGRIINNNDQHKQAEPHAPIIEQSPSILQKTLITNSKRKTKTNPNLIHLKLQPNLNPRLKILTLSQNNHYTIIIQSSTLKKSSKFTDRIKLMKPTIHISSDDPTSILLQNHLPVNGLLGNKKAMFYMLKQYYLLTGNTDLLFNTVPLTFHIRKGVKDEEYKELVKRYYQEKGGYWIVKPGEFSNRGQGISCTNQIQEIRSRVQGLKREGRSLIVQRYITNPLLYNGRKFDIRCYMLVAVNNGRLRGYWYEDGYVRTSSSTWNLESISDPLAHLTNDAIQKHSPSYGKYEPGNKLAYSQLQRYLLAHHPTCNLQLHILPLLKQMATDALRASSLFIDPLRSGNNFELFGLDFMIDSNYKPWLIEINTNPCLQTTCPVLQRIIPNMLENTFRIAVDPLFPPPLNFSCVSKYSIAENALHYNKFEVIFDEERDGRQLKELYKESRVMEEIDEYEEDQELYEDMNTSPQL